ncbi:hypothetical protein M8J76_004991 [Diaphorina citri]|nr:hypothetical protein M8J76_004991 [Diaphorina citri]
MPHRLRSKGKRTNCRTSPKLCLTESEVKTKHEWLPNAPTRPLRRKLYKNSARPRHRETKTKTGTVKTKATKIKTKLKSLVSRKCHPQPPLSKFSNLKTRRLCYLRRHSESSSSSGNSVLEASFSVSGHDPEAATFRAESWELKFNWNRKLETTQENKGEKEEKEKEEEEKKKKKKEMKKKKKERKKKKKRGKQGKRRRRKHRKTRKHNS